MGNDEELHLTLPAEPHSVGEIRHAVARRAEALGMAQPNIDDLTTVVSEACANVVLHAYEESGEPGPLEVELVPEVDQVGVVVRDFGTGIRPRRSAGPPSLRMGLRLIGALSSRFHLISARDRGTEIRIYLQRGAVPTA